MKRIILGLSLLLMLVQNGFAASDEEFDANIKRTTGWQQQCIKCEKEANNHTKDGNIQECVKAVKLLENLSNSNPNKRYLGSISYNTGQMYFFGQDNKIKAYEYWYKAAKYGYKGAQHNLNLLCEQYPWACK